MYKQREKQNAEEVSKKLLSNPVIEYFESSETLMRQLAESIQLPLN